MDARPVSLHELLGFTLVAFLIFAVAAWLFGCVEENPLQTALSPTTTIEVIGD